MTTRDDRTTHRRYGRSGLRLPAVSLGLRQRSGTVDPHETSRAVVPRAFDLGVAHLDRANDCGPEPGSAGEASGRILARSAAARERLALAPVERTARDRVLPADAAEAGGGQ